MGFAALILMVLVVLALIAAMVWGVWEGITRLIRHFRIDHTSRTLRHQH